MLSALRHLLVNQAQVTDLISDRVYPSRIPQAGELPAVTLRKTRVAPHNTKEAPSKLDEMGVTAEIYARRYEEIELISKAIRRVFDYYKGQVLDIDISKIIYLDEADGYEEEARIHVRDMDFIIYQNT